MREHRYCYTFKFEYNMSIFSIVLKLTKLLGFSLLTIYLIIYKVLTVYTLDLKHRHYTNKLIQFIKIQLFYC